MLSSHLKPGMTVLELGCGAGYFTRELARSGAESRRDRRFTGASGNREKPIVLRQMFSIKSRMPMN